MLEVVCHDYQSLADGLACDNHIKFINRFAPLFQRILASDIAVQSDLNPTAAGISISNAKWRIGSCLYPDNPFTSPFDSLVFGLLHLSPYMF